MTAPALTQPRRRQWELFVTLVQRQMWLRRKRSVLSLAWPVLSPFLLMLLYVFVFKRVFRAPIARYHDFLLCGLLPWGFLAVTVGKAGPSIASEPQIVRRARFRYELLALSTVAAQLVNLVLSLGAFLVWLAVNGNLPRATLPALPLVLLALTLLVMGISTLVALVDVYNRDLRQVMGNLLTVWFFLVPIVYQPRMAPRGVQFLRSVDPMNLIVGQMRDILYFGSLTRPGHLLLMLGSSALFFAAAVAVFRRFAADLAKDV